MAYQWFRQCCDRREVAADGECGPAMIWIGYRIGFAGDCSAGPRLVTISAMSPKARASGPSAFILIIVGIVMLLVGWTAMNFRGGAADEEDTADRGTAVGAVQKCQEVGPVSLSGVGYWWKCTVKVSPEDGDSYSQVFGGSQFEPADVGRNFPLVSAGRSSSTWSRADVAGNNWAVMVTAGGLVIGVVCLVMAGRKVLRR